VAVRRRVEALVARESLSEGTPERGYDNVIRELTYTLLNRLVGLKAMEARKLLYLPPPGEANAAHRRRPTSSHRSPGQARSRYLRDFRAAAGSRYKYEEDAEEALLRDGLTSAFRHVTSEIRVLFDPDHEYAMRLADARGPHQRSQDDQRGPACGCLPRAGLPRLGLSVLQSRREEAGSRREQGHAALLL
jgi:hypothetical protein